MGRGEAEKGDSQEDGQLPWQSSGRETRQARAWTRLQSPFISFSNFFCLFLSVICQEHCASRFALAGLDSWGPRSHTSLPETWGGQLAAASSHPGRSGGLGAPARAFQRRLPVLSSSEPDREVLYLLPSSTVSPSCLITQWRCQNLRDASPHNSRATGHPRGFAAPSAEPGFVWSGLWLWRKGLGGARPPGAGCGREADGASLRQPLRPTLGSSVLSLQRCDGRGCAQTWEPQLRAPSSVCPSRTVLLLWHPHGMSLFPISSVPLPASGSLYLCAPPPPSAPVSLIPVFVHGLPHPVFCSQTVSDSMSALSLCLALPPRSWLPPMAPVPLPSLLRPVCQSARAPGVRDRKSRPGADCGPCSMKESDLKPGRPGQAEAKNFSLTRRAGYLV